MSRLGRGLVELAMQPRLLQVVKLGPMHHSGHLQGEVHHCFAFDQPYGNHPEKWLFGAVRVSPCFWDGGPGVAEDFPQ